MDLWEAVVVVVVDVSRVESGSGLWRGDDGRINQPTQILYYQRS